MSRAIDAAAVDERLAQELSAAREAFSNYRESLKVTPQDACFRQDDRSIRRAHAEAIKQNALSRHRLRKIVIGAGSKHHSNMDNDACKHALYSGKNGLRDMKMEGVNYGSVLVLQIVAQSYRNAALQLLVSDSAGWLVRVALYHASVSREKQLLPDTVLYVKEPFICRGSGDSYFIRVDSPSDIVIWPSIHQLLRPPTAFKRITSPEEAKEIGSRFFVEGHYHESLHAYRQGLFWYSASNTTTALLALNCAAAFLKLDKPHSALDVLAEYCSDEHLNEIQQDKVVHRALLACKAMPDRPVEAVFATLQPSFRARLQRDEHKFLRDLVTKGHRSAEFPIAWIDTFQQVKRGEAPQLADFTHPSLVVRDVNGKGRGIFAGQNIAKGTLLIVARPLAQTSETPDNHALVSGLNLATDSLDPPSHTNLVAQVFDALAEDPSIAVQLDSLYAGPHFPRPAPGSDPVDVQTRTKVSLDAGRAEAICAYNSFHLGCMTRPLVGPGHADADDDEAESGLALYGFPSFLNHACIGNAAYSFLKDRFILRSLDDIAAGDEILDSYCDGSANLLQRRSRFGRFGFTCTCNLCRLDKQDGMDSVKRRRDLAREWEKMTSRSGLTIEEIQWFCDEVNATYSSKRSTLRPEMFRIYRQTSECYASTPDEAQQAFQADLNALKSIGATFAITLSKQSTTVDREESIFTKYPVLKQQDAVIACIKLANDCMNSGNTGLSRLWLADAEHIHDLLFGAGLFETRMGLFAKERGWRIR